MQTQTINAQSCLGLTANALDKQGYRGLKGAYLHNELEPGR